MAISTLQQLVAADLRQSNALMTRYNRSSSLRGRERFHNRPNVCTYRRDRVLLKLMEINQIRVVENFFSAYRLSVHIVSPNA